MSRASYSIISNLDDVILLKDNNGRVSVTNDAEAVVAEVIRDNGFKNDSGHPWKIHYINTMGNRSELLHANGTFLGFA